MAARSGAARCSAAAPAGPSLDPAELEKFLINFVVEQTGYPPEMVELDADLEADLGIDSIKKAQLFGELAEYFDVQPNEDMTLDDFPTLRHVMNFLAAAPIEGRLRGDAQHRAVAAAAPAPAHPVAPALLAPASRLLLLQPATAAARAHVGPTSLDPAELEKFLVNFVVEQTGYPPEVVELDADLEADLGIDSIKKAQLFGELAEYFDVQPNENMTLDDFPTLRHVLNFLAAAPVKGSLAGSAPTDPRRRAGICRAPLSSAPAYSAAVAQAASVAAAAAQAATGRTEP